MARFKKKVQPKYPELLREEEIEGSVHLTVVVNRYGNVVDVKVKSSDHELMTAAAIEAIKQFVFTPATVNGVPVTSTIDDVPFIFVLDE
jgi:protein TonB